MPREQTVKDLGQFLASEKLSVEEIEFLYKILRNRLVCKTCYLCGEMKPKFNGVLEWRDGDMSKPKTFACADCKGIL